MRALAILVLAILLSSTSALAGEIFGQIRDDGVAVKNTQVTVKCSASYGTRTDEAGSYSVYVDEQGKVDGAVLNQNGRAMPCRRLGVQPKIPVDLAVAEKYVGRYESA